MTLQTERVRTLDQVRAFVEGSEVVDPRFHGGRLSRVPTGSWSTSSCTGRWCGWTTEARQVGQGAAQTLLGEGDGAVEAQLTRLTGQHRETGASRIGVVASRRAPSSGATPSASHRGAPRFR